MAYEQWERDSNNSWRYFDKSHIIIDNYDAWCM